MPPSCPRIRAPFTAPWSGRREGDTALSTGVPPPPFKGGGGQGEVGGKIQRMVKPRTHRARSLRKDATAAERLLWRALRDAALPVRIRRQHPIGRYIADFAIPARKLVIEIDGGQHVTAARRDAARTGNLEAQGWRVIRFWNNDVTGNLAGVLETIAAEIEKTPTSPQPSPPPGAERE